MKYLLSSLLCLALASTTHAALLTTEGSGSKIEKLTLPTSGVTSVDGDSLKLTAVGAGLRTKKVVFVNVKVYVGQLFVNSLESFKKTDSEALSSLKEQKAVAIQMHFLRDVDADNVQKSFREALKANGVDTNEAPTQQFLESVKNGGEAKEGKNLTVVGAKLKDGSEVISYETTGGTISQIKGEAGFVEKIFSIWLGKPSDSGVADLKKAILK